MQRSSTLVLIACGVVLAGLAVAFVQDRTTQRATMDPYTLEHLSHEDMGLPPHYWAYLQHSWEWSDLYDPEKAREALTQSILKNEPNSLVNMFTQLSREDRCDLLNVPNEHPAIEEAHKGASPDTYLSYEMVRWVCLSNDVSPPYSLQDLLEATKTDRSGLGSVVKLLLTERLHREGALPTKPDKFFRDVIRLNWKTNGFLLTWMRYAWEYNSQFLDMTYAKEWEIDRGILVAEAYHSDIPVYIGNSWGSVPRAILEKNLKDYKFELRKYKEETREFVFEIKSNGYHLAENPLYYCSFSYDEPTRADLCIQRASFDHFSCNSIMYGREPDDTAAYEACRFRFLDVNYD